MPGPGLDLIGEEQLAGFDAAISPVVHAGITPRAWAIVILFDRPADSVEPLA